MIGHPATGCLVMSTRYAGSGEGEWIMDDQRDYAEEAANRSAMEQEGREEHDQVTMALSAWDRLIAPEWRVTLINMADAHVRTAHGVGSEAHGERLMVIMVHSMINLTVMPIGPDGAAAVVRREIHEARMRKGV